MTYRVARAILIVGWGKRSLYIKKMESSFERLRMRQIRCRSLARDRQARLIGWAPTSKSVGVTVWLSYTGSLAGVRLRSGGLVNLGLLT